ncbi:class I SAM-dependent methyltransferase [Candidatus Nomurabacteria bacterium]|nr:class I SAM-dependent methyltransferase [Candidatus Nomurabacteria bacterium]
MISAVEGKKLMQENQKLYDKIAKQFADTRTFVWDDLKPFAGYVKEGNQILDVACGSGRLYQIFAKNQVQYTGVDFSKELIEIAKEENPECTFFVRDMTDLRLPRESFDVVFCIAALQHLPNEDFRLQALRQMKEVVKTDGLVILLNWNLYSHWAKDKYHRFEFQKQEFMIPWRTGGGEEIGRRYYHGFLPEELEKLFEISGLGVQMQYFTKKGELSDQERGENIVSILRG